MSLIGIGVVAPCLWFDAEAQEAAAFYVSLFPNSRITAVQRQSLDGPAFP